MRNRFIDILVKKARENDKIVLIIGDLGYSVVEKFAEEFPNRFYNAGIAEQNMASLAAGLASQGFHVFIYSIANFPTFRCAEQLRNDIGYHNLPVTVVSVGGGLSYGSLGYSHHAIQDIGLVRLLPEFKLLTPGDPLQTEICMNHIINNPSPSYLRLKKAGEPIFTVYKKPIKDGEWIKIIKSKNNKILLTVSGGLFYAMEAIKKNPELKNHGVYSCPIWSSKSKNIQNQFLSLFDEITTIEDHLIDGGFGSWLLEAANIENRKKINIIGLNQNIIGKVGSENYLSDLGGLTDFKNYTK